MKKIIVGQIWRANEDSFNWKGETWLIESRVDGQGRDSDSVKIIRFWNNRDGQLVAEELWNKLRTNGQMCTSDEDWNNFYKNFTLVN